jgi:hypothetical protein
MAPKSHASACCAVEEYCFAIKRSTRWAPERIGRPFFSLRRAMAKKFDFNRSNEEFSRLADQIAELLRDRDAPIGLTIGNYIAAIEKVDSLLFELRFFTDEDGLHCSFKRSNGPPSDI